MGIEKNYKKISRKQIVSGILGIIILILLLTITLFQLTINLDVFRNGKVDLNTEKLYEVKISNWIGATIYYCDSTHQEKNVLELYSVGDDDEDIKIIIPKNIIVKITKQ